MDTFINMLIISDNVAKIISVSLNDNILRDIDKLEKDMGFSGRSEVIRAGVRMLLNEQKELGKLKGKIDAVMTIIHDDHESDDVSKIRHKYQRIVKTQVHNHLENDKCLEIFVLCADSDLVKAAYKEFKSSRVDFVRLMVT